jgi:hypothetical protein
MLLVGVLENCFGLLLTKSLNSGILRILGL